MGTKKGLNRLLALTMFVFYVSALASATLFYHVHEVDGLKVYHSHFFLDTESDAEQGGGHTHSEAGFLTIALVSYLSEIALLPVVAALLLHVVLLRVVSTPCIREALYRCAERLPSRAPPTSYCLR